jgi:hypothetical protein
MGKKRSQTHTSSRDKRQKKITIVVLSLADGLITFASCFPKHNKSNAPTHE